MNMGTPMQPEGVPHWSNKVMWRHKLELNRRHQQGFWLFYDTCCGRCEAGGYVENILDGVTTVRMEAEQEGYRPDILLERAVAGGHSYQPAVEGIEGTRDHCGWRSLIPAGRRRRS